MVEKAGNRDLWSANIIDSKANKGLKHQPNEEDFQTLSFWTYQFVVPRTTSKMPLQRITPSNNPKSKALNANHDDSTSVNIFALPET